MWRGRVLCFIILFGSPLTSIAAEEGAPAVAGAQPDSELAEIIGTAQKRSERVTDVPLSITAVSGDELAGQGVTSASDLVRVVPGFTFQPSSRDEPVYAIRVKEEITKAYPAGPWTDLPYLQDRGEYRRRLLAERAARLSAMIHQRPALRAVIFYGESLRPVWSDICGLNFDPGAIIRCRARMSRISCCCLIRRRDASFGAALPR
jgi:hypothetical protein